MPAIPRQRRYDQVMGDRESKVTDKRFVQELQQRLEQKHTTAELLKERRLAEAESRRVRKLVLDGIIDPADARHGDGGGRVSGRARDNQWKEFWPPNPYKTLAEYEDEKRRKSEEVAPQPHTEQSESQKAPDADPTAANEGSAAAAGHQAEPAPAEQRSAQQTVGRYEGTQSPRIDELMREEDLDRLYSKASEIVYIMTPPAKKQQAGKTSR